MSDEIEKVVEPTEDVTKLAETEQPKNTDKKVFEQSEVNGLIAREVQKEKAKTKKFADELEAKNSQIEFFENIFSETVGEMKKNMSPEILELLEEKSIVDQYQWLVKHSKSDNTTKKVIKETPKSEETKPKIDFSKHRL